MGSHVIEDGLSLSLSCWILRQRGWDVVREGGGDEDEEERISDQSW